MDELTKEKDEEDSTDRLVDKKEHTVMKAATSCELNEEEEEDNEFYDAVDEIKKDKAHEPEMEQPV